MNSDLHKSILDDINRRHNPQHVGVAFIALMISVVGVTIFALEAFA